MGRAVSAGDAGPESAALKGLPAPSYLPSLQVLRGIAALWVVLFHIEWFHIGSFGVDIFFVLSGFVIAHVTMSDSRHFFIKRLIRIVPLYYAATLAQFVAALALPQLFAATEPTWANLWRSLMFIPYARGDGAVQPLLFLGWTLNYEMLFYAIFGLALLVSAARAPIIAIAALIALAAVGLVVPEGAVAAHFWSRPIVLEFALGLAIQLWWRRTAPVDAPMWQGGALALLGMALLVINPTHAMGWEVPLHFPIAGLYAAMMLVGMLSMRATRWPRPLIVLGDISFSLYLLHPFAVQAIARLYPLAPTGLGLIFSALAVISAILLAWLSYRLIERPSLRFLRKHLIQSNEERA